MLTSALARELCDVIRIAVQAHPYTDDDVGGGGPSVGENSIIRTNGTNIEENITVGPSFNGGVESKLHRSQ